MANRNVDKGREAENAVARVFREAGFPDAERRTKRGGYVELDGERIPADAGDLTGIHRDVVVQVKWSGYKPLLVDLQRTDEQRRVAGARIGLLVRKRPRVGCARAAEWDAYLTTGQVMELLQVQETDRAVLVDLAARPWNTDLWTAARLIAARYSSHVPSYTVEHPSPVPL